MPHPTDQLPAWAYRALALLAGAIGLTASAVTAQFFIVGLQLIEADAPARDALVAAGVLMIVTALSAFFVSALLPAQQLRALRAQLLLCASLLVAFECSTIYLTQRAMISTADALASSLQTRIDHAQDSITAHRATATALRSNGAAQSDSKYHWIRSDGAATLQRAAVIDQQIAPLAHELASLQAQQRPTITAALGHDGMLAYSVARALLVSITGLVMCGAAGALLRAARHINAAPTLQPAAATAALPVATVAPASSRWRSVALPLTAITLTPAVFAAAPAPPAAPALRATPIATATPTDARYERLRTGVQRGDIKPSVRAMHAAVGGSTLAMRDYQAQLVADGVIERHGQGYRARPTTQTALIFTNPTSYHT